MLTERAFGHPLCVCQRVGAENAIMLMQAAPARLVDQSTEDVAPKHPHWTVIKRRRPYSKGGECHKTPRRLPPA
jgi:hypothetical protein